MIFEAKNGQRNQIQQFALLKSKAAISYHQ